MNTADIVFGLVPEVATILRRFGIVAMGSRLMPNRSVWTDCPIANMQLAAAVAWASVRRGDRTSVIQMMRACERTLTAGNSIMMFPEGTRSPSGRMRRFKPGAFELAIKSGRPIQPVVLQGTHNALPKRGFVLQGRHPISITVLDAVTADAYAGRRTTSQQPRA